MADYFECPVCHLQSRRINGEDMFDRTAPEVSELREWRTIDDPIVRPADGERSCTSCACWSQWLGETGDCLFHAYQRREAIIAAQDARELKAARERWPSRSARMSAADEVCDGWAALSDTQQKRRDRRAGGA